MLQESLEPAKCTAIPRLSATMPESVPDRYTISRPGSFPDWGFYTSALNYSSRYSSQRDPAHKCLLQFSDEFLATSDEISEWYYVQPYKRFNTIQYRKEKTGVRHEFILLRLQGEEGGGVMSHCRLERLGGPEHRFQTIYVDGTIAEDYIHAIPLENPQYAELTSNSDLVIEITFPITFDLRDVLAICYGISKHRKAKRYTLQQYNCYFFSWTIVTALARACINWNIGGTFLENHIRNIQERILQSIDEQGPARFHTLAYILSNNASNVHESGGWHPLDRAIISRISTEDFANSISEAFHSLLWVDTLRARLAIAVMEQLSEIACESSNLLDFDEPQHEGLDSSNLRNRKIADTDVVCAVRKAAEKATMMGAKSALAMGYRLVEEVARDATLIKQRMGSRAWYRYVRRGLLQPLYTSKTRNNDEYEPKDSSLRQTKESAIRDYLLIVPTVMLSFSFRLGFTPVLGALQALSARAFLEIPKGWTSSKRIESALALQYATKQELSGEVSEFFNVISPSQLSQLLLECWAPALELLDNTLREVGANDESHLRIIRQDLLHTLREIEGILPADFDMMWEAILLQHSDRMVQVAHSGFQEPVKQASAATVFRVVEGKGESEPSQNTTFSTNNCGERIRGGEGSTSLPLDGIDAPKSAGQDSNQWSYDKLQGFIRGRISQLSKRETEFAPVLKHIPHILSPEKCQLQIEATMEEIWESCRPLMAAGMQGYTPAFELSGCAPEMLNEMLDSDEWA